MTALRRSMLLGVATLAVAGACLLSSAVALAATPAIVAESAVAVSPFDATVEAQINPERQETAYHFEYAASEAKLLRGEGTSVGEGSLPGTSEAQTVGPVDIGGGLESGMTYYYRVIATNATGSTEGEAKEFTTEAKKPPSIDGESATGVTQTDAQLHALINANDQTTSYQFKLGTDTSYTLATIPITPGELGAAFGDQEVGIDLGGEGVELEPNTEYHFEAVASNTAGSTDGLVARGDEHFLTLPTPPTVITGEATEVSANTATIAGSVNPGSSGVNSDTSYYFQYSTDTSYSTQIPSVAADAGQGTSPVPETASLTGLQPNTTYHYRIIATNDNANAAGGAPQLVYGEAKTFTTPATPPLLGPATASAITQSTATITATLDAQGLPTHWELRLGNTSGELEPQAAGNTEGSSALPLALNVASLSPGTVYYYKMIAVNPNGTVETPEAAFTTAPTPAPQSATLFPPTPLLTLPNVSFPTEETGTTTSVPKALTRAQKLKNALRACRTDKSKTKRTVCERQARKKYPPANRQTTK
jgi:hypothetical protein